MKQHRIFATCLLGIVAFSGCGDNKNDLSQERIKAMAGGQLKAVVPVSGVVTVDGSPAAGVNLFLYRPDGFTAIMECRTDGDGKYCWTTYKGCDGLEPGSYLLGFTHVPKPKKNDTGVDELKGKYKNPQKNKMQLEVEAGVPQTDVNYDLVTK